jgi:hypothetical protein
MDDLNAFSLIFMKSLFRDSLKKRKYPPGMEILEKYLPLTRKKRAELYEMHNPDPVKLQNLITSVSKSSKITVSSSRTKKITEMRGMRF